MTNRERLIELFYENNVRCDQTVEELADDVLDIISNSATVNEWRPVSEPPKEDGAYLVSLTSFSGKHTWQDICKFANNLEKVDNFDFKGIKRAGWYSYKDGDYYEIDDITHWMPLPSLRRRWSDGGISRSITVIS